MLVFMTLYMVDVTGFFACLQALNRDGKPMETIQDMAGLVKQRPGIALAMTAFSLSALGLLAAAARPARSARAGRAGPPAAFLALHGRAAAMLPTRPMPGTPSPA